MGLSEPFNIFIGYDSRESVCSYVAAHSISRRTRSTFHIHFLNHRELRKAGLFKRAWITENENGENVDLQDGKTFSTEFSHTRFLVPHLMKYEGWALFIDADMLMLTDIRKLFALCDPKYALMCVKHNYPARADGIKMDGRAQRTYFRKNWSSLMLLNCGHPANAPITPEKVNFLPGKDLHGFSWLKDEHIGALPFTYNYISGISPKLPPERGGRPDLVHYSDGGPWFDECKEVPLAHLWTEEYEDWQRSGGGNKYTNIPSTRFER